MKYLILLSFICFNISCGYNYQGPKGLTGNQGPIGNPGLNAQPCSVVQTNSGATIQCPDGTTANISNGLQGPQGIQGLTGATGNQGVAGTNGTNGSNGTIITTVQFCPNVTQYASTFSEIGFCINGNIYAVYSQNDGFLTYTPPGTYSSNGINSSCTFTILPNCVIQN